MTKIWCKVCQGCGKHYDLISQPTCEICGGKGWIPHPTCQQCDEFYLDEQGFLSKVAMCRVFGICVNPMGYCHLNSELED